MMKMAPIDIFTGRRINEGHLPEGTIVGYMDAANPLRLFAVSSEPTPYGQVCYRIDGKER